MGIAIHHPLSITNPEYSTRTFPGYYEYRVENWHLARDGSNKVVRRTSVFSWSDAVVLVVILALWKPRNGLRNILLGASLAFRMWFKFTQVQSESLIILPPHGVQLETRHGLPYLPCLFTRRKFIPLTTIHDCIINEGLKGWSVRYYLTVAKHVGRQSFALEVMFENILPHYSVLSEVYSGVHEILLDKKQ